jgi:hypothetical protein
VRRLDHILVAAADPVAAMGRLLREYGLGVAVGPKVYGGWANLVVALRETQFLCVVYVPDDAEPENPWARWLRGRPPDHFELIGWAIETDELDAIAERHGLRPQRQAAILGHGHALTWRSVAEPTTRIGSLPFYVQYDQPRPRRQELLAPLYTAARHRVEPLELAWVTTGASVEDLDRWLGDRHDLPIRRGGGEPVLRDVGIRLGDGSTVAVRSLDLPTLTV